MKLFTVSILMLVLACVEMQATDDAKQKMKFRNRIDARANDTTHLYELQYRCSAQNFINHNPSILKGAIDMGNGRYDVTRSTDVLAGPGISRLAHAEIDVRNDRFTVRHRPGCGCNQSGL